METDSAPECLRRKRWFGRKMFGYNEKAESKMVTKRGHKVESGIIFMMMIFILR